MKFSFARSNPRIFKPWITAPSPPISSSCSQISEQKSEKPKLKTVFGKYELKKYTPGHEIFFFRINHVCFLWKEMSFRSIIFVPFIKISLSHQSEQSLERCFSCTYQSVRFLENQTFFNQSLPLIAQGNVYGSISMELVEKKSVLLIRIMFGQQIFLFIDQSFA